MAIGKNAIKRVENNGYSNVKTATPDMENSHVIANPDPQVTEKLIALVETATAVKKTPAKKPATKKPTVKKTAVKPADKKNGFERVGLGTEMPYYLL